MPTNKDSKVSPDPGAKPSIDLATIPAKRGQSPFLQKVITESEPNGVRLPYPARR